ncbi:MAG TPA: 2-dehydropantoate 2-reductase [Hypericibacter adhaerens]|uniref:2-dehydropantoate 2-reductase n=1 Tax=Hypericibacter adhaerens TaxID=2602016 RepID=UPI002BDD9274|nr:2-dehydropantoate 2-reductase [Hypericibacter adhaerens]HWA44039.1 2-dehydropantoate 2-reductase [Hypericibacter adhaerens]
MKICIYGAGAIGGFIGARLARAGEEVSLIARGPHLAAMKAKGLKLLSEEGDFTVTPRCAADPAELGPQDYVVLALKAPAVAGIVEQMQPLLGPKTAVVMAVNGVPWWYFHDLEGPWRDRRLKTVDPDDRQWRGIGPGRVLGCVVYPAAEVAEPGVVRHQSGDRFSLGEPDGSKSDRAVALSRAMIAAGLKAPVKPDIRTEIWVKLWGNVAFNPISALTGGTLKRICEDPSTRALARSIMNEAEAVANKLGVKMPIDVERRIEGAAGVGEHKTSMLQDLERGRPTEIDAIVGAVAELGDVVGQDTPYIDAIYALVRQKAALLGVYP